MDAELSGLAGQAQRFCGFQPSQLLARSFPAARPSLPQWVEGAVPLYELHTGWQQARAQRQRWLAAAAQQQQQPAGAPAVQAVRGGRVITVSRPAGAAGAAGVGRRPAAAQQRPPPQQQQQLLRPIDLFYAKLKVGLV